MLAASALAQSPLADTARLQGSYALTGRITTARNVRGEHSGQTVLRTWTFTPLCPTGSCQQIGLTRQRAGGSDYVVLNLTAADQYSGTGLFYAPLRCGGRTVRRGESVPFSVTVEITDATSEAGGPVATAIDSTYTNRTRHNRTRCVAPPSHDAATYSGSTG